MISQHVYISVHQDKVFRRHILAVIDPYDGSEITPAPAIDVLASRLRNLFEGEVDVATAYLHINGGDIKAAIKDFVQDVEWERSEGSAKTASVVGMSSSSS